MRRGIGETALVAIILAVVGGLVVGGVVGTIVIKGKARIDIEACKANVATAALSKQTLPVTKCYTNPVGELEFSGKESDYVPKVSRQIADLVSDCKYQFGEVNALPWKGPSFRFFEGYGICFVCSTFSLPVPKGKSFASLKTQDILDWMNNNTRTTGENYLSYVLSRAPGGYQRYIFADEYLLDETLIDEITITTPTSYVSGVDYAVMHVGFPHTRATQVTGRGGLMFTSEAAAETNWIMVQRLENLHKGCAITFTRYP